MDPQEQLADDQSNASDSVEVQEKPEDTTTGDPVTEDVIPQQLTENEESTVNRVDVPDTSAREETEPEETVAEQATMGLGEESRLGAEEGDPVTEDVLPQQLTENEESTVNRVDVLDTSAREETEPEETVAEQATMGLGEDPRLGAEEGQYPPQDTMGLGEDPRLGAEEGQYPPQDTMGLGEDPRLGAEEGQYPPQDTMGLGEDPRLGAEEGQYPPQDTMGLGEEPRLGAEEGQYPPQGLEGEGGKEGSEKSDGHVLAEAEAITTEFTENFPEKQQAEKPPEQTTSEALVEIEPNKILEVKDSKVGSDEPVEGRPAPDDDRGGETSAAEKIKDKSIDMPMDTPKTMMRGSKENVGREEFFYMESPSPNASITVKVKLLPVEQVVTVASRLGQSVSKFKEYFAAELKMQPSEISLLYDRVMLSDLLTLGLLGVEPNGTIELELESADPENTPLKHFMQISGLEHDIVSVNIPEEDGSVRTVTVEIEKDNKKKPFLGGFRHRLDGTEFHNATAQTLQKRRPWPVNKKYTRSTQTYELRNKDIQTAQDTSTQMTKIGCFVSITADKLMAPGKYFTAKEKEDLILEKVIILQKYLRQYLAKKYVNSLKMKRDRRREFERLKYIQRKEEKEKRIKLEFERRMHPRAKNDFDTLYDALEKWRLEEIARINATLTGAERKAALYMLLNEETEHLAAIGRHRLEADTENRENSIQKFLHKTAAPKTITSTYDNLPTAIDTPFTVRAKELRDIYDSIIMKHLTQDERLDILLTLKYTIQEHDCKLTQEILKLIDREADLLCRGVSNVNLEGLRKRIATLFLQYIKTPLFNPEAAKFIKVPPDSTKLSGKIYFCISCNSYLLSTQFPLNVNARNPGSCQQCKKKDNEGRNRTDYGSYRHMLKVLRLSEEQYNDGSTVCFILQEADMRYLVEKIWGSESIISNSNDLYDLIFVRWDSDIPWSPWNCILVTIDEAEKHGKLFHIYKDYGQVFINKVQLKHQQARNYFSRLRGTAELLHYKQQPHLVIDGTEHIKSISKQTSCSTFLKQRTPVISSASGKQENVKNI